MDRLGGPTHLIPARNFLVFAAPELSHAQNHSQPQRADTYSIMVEPRPAGATIGLYRGLPIAERVVDQFDRRFTFAGIIGRRRDGQYDVNALKPGQFVVEPGLVYDLEVGEGREKQEVRAELPPEPQSESAGSGVAEGRG